MLDIQFVGLEDLLARWESEQLNLSAGMAGAVDASAKAGAARARADAPRRTGTMIESTTGNLVRQTTRTATAEINVGVDYASFVSYGTVPHIIQARRARTLAFEQDGVWRFPFRVRHPGNKPNPYLDQAVDVARTKLADEIADVVRRAAERMGG